MNYCMENFDENLDENIDILNVKTKIIFYNKIDNINVG